MATKVTPDVQPVKDKGPVQLDITNPAHANLTYDELQALGTPAEVKAVEPVAEPAAEEVTETPAVETKEEITTESEAK